MHQYNSIPAQRRPRNPWTWVPTLYFAEGLPYFTVMTVAVVLYKRFGLSNADIALYTSWLYLPWVIKPFWSPFVDIIKSKRWWITTMQLFIGAGMAGIAFTLPTPFYLQVSLVFFWLMAFSSATHDIAADGFYMHALNDSQQSFFVGIRSTFYRLASIFGQGVLIIIAGLLEKSTANIKMAWSITFFISAGLFIALFLYHRFILPRPLSDKDQVKHTPDIILKEFGKTFVSFFTKKGIGLALAFILLYRLAEAMLVKLSYPFLLDTHSAGGLALSTEQAGIVYGTIGVIALTLGGILGGIVASRQGLKFWLWPMALSITLPNIAYLFLAMTQTERFLWVNVAVAIEQFGYGFGYTAYTLFLMYFSEGERKTSHFAICTGIMALGMMLPGMVAGKLQEMLGYQHFYILVMILTIPTLLLIPFMKIDKNYGKAHKTATETEANSQTGGN